MAKDPNLIKQVSDELAKHPGVVAYVNEESGAVQACVAPVPHWQQPKKGEKGGDKAANAAPRIIVRDVENGAATPEEAMSPVEPLDTTGRLTPQQISALKREQADLRGQLDSAGTAERAKINDRLAKLDAMLKREEAAAEADRVSADRLAERRAQERQGGPAGGREPRPLPTTGNAKEEPPASLAALAKQTGKKVIRSASGAYMLV